MFVGLEAYEAAGGVVLRDLFQERRRRLAAGHGAARAAGAREARPGEAEAVRAEGWRWVEVAPDFPYGHTFGLRRLAWASEPLSDEEQAERDSAPGRV